MDESPLLDVDGALAIPRSELSYRATRAGGPGGQHVNTSSTRVELEWDVANSAAPTDAQRARLLERLAARMSGAGVLRLTESGSRSQYRNREVVTERLVELVAAALREPKTRKKTRAPRRAREQRLREKKTRGETKRLRKPVDPGEG